MGAWSSAAAISRSCRRTSVPRSGLGRTWQATELFDDLTVRREPRRRRALGRGLGEPVRDALARRRASRAALDELPSELSQGERKLVGVARALAGSPRVVCLDEPAAGLDSAESEQLGRRLREVADGGTGMLLVDHDMGLVLSVCDEIVVLEFGQVIATGTPEEVRRDRRVVEAYLGAAGADRAAERLDIAEEGA